MSQAHPGSNHAGVKPESLQAAEHMTGFGPVASPLGLRNELQIDRKSRVEIAQRNNIVTNETEKNQEIPAQLGPEHRQQEQREAAQDGIAINQRRVTLYSVPTCSTQPAAMETHRYPAGRHTRSAGGSHKT
jgi:hypothetical protein